MSIRARMVVALVEQYIGDNERVKLNAVYSSDKSDPNYSWSQATPSGSLELYISNPGATGKLRPGKTYDITITEAE